MWMEVAVYFTVKIDGRFIFEENIEMSWMDS